MSERPAGAGRAACEPARPRPLPYLVQDTDFSSPAANLAVRSRDPVLWTSSIHLANFTQKFLDFTPKRNRGPTAPRPLTPTPQPGARPTGLANCPGACGATPRPERARTGGAAATPRKIPLENPGVGAGRGNWEKREPGAPTCKLSGRPRRRRRLSHRETVSNPCGPPRSPPPYQPRGGDFRARIPRPLPTLAVAARARRRCHGDAPGNSEAGLPYSFPRTGVAVCAPRRCHGDAPGCRAASRLAG